MTDPKPRYTPAMREAINELAKSARLACERHDLTASEVVVALAVVAAQWVPRSSLQDTGLIPHDR